MKTPKTFRLDPITIERLTWLAKKLGTTETHVVESAITFLHFSEYFGLKLNQNPENKNGE
ncbi:hypothetical protein [Flavonifractor sp. An4]|uniref:hypothetical protein n=1 Tax=Flavonifractor sp. An4 TaxID=1965634 RepID=UPI000B388DB2|nr:hypothetical protein [Flavonifractor sp. An4]OUO08130.1 hypothetical protein B5F94_15555 [Flavonifractor sp. An4]